MALEAEVYLLVVPASAWEVWVCPWVVPAFALGALA